MVQIKSVRCREKKETEKGGLIIFLIPGNPSRKGGKGAMTPVAKKNEKKKHRRASTNREQRGPLSRIQAGEGELSFVGGEKNRRGKEIFPGGERAEIALRGVEERLITSSKNGIIVRGRQLYT